MFTDEATKNIEQAIEAETENAINKYGKYYASKHEAYAVLKEEIEEAAIELDGIQTKMEWMWTSIRQNKKPLAFPHLIQAMRIDAINLIKEACQIAAVCNKFDETIRQETENE